MGLFKRKPDPITERAKLLNQKIAALEQQIQQLASLPAQHPKVREESKAKRSAPFAAAGEAQPRFRSAAGPDSSGEPVFEEVGKGSIQSDDEPPTPAHYNDLGVRKYDLASAWRRVKNHFRGPVTSNPKLVHYLSAGSIQGLRPLRYEKRVARNRFIFFATALLLVLWGVIAIILGK